ncbi:MAG: Flp pilus assembly complex ATPase component TadA [Candidatus Scalindua sp.]|nr:Flp pilus assembly complex ATPase component TadA [Candidatus Scalindua sp.]
MMISPKTLGQILREKGVITDEQLKKAVVLKDTMSIRLDEAIMKLGFLGSEDILHGFAEQFDLKIVNPLDILIPDTVIHAVPKEIAKKYHIIPIDKQNGLLTVAITNPLDLSISDDLRFTLNTEVECVLSTHEKIEKAIKKYYDKEEEIAFEGFYEGLTETTTESPKLYQYFKGVEKKADSPIVKLVSSIVNEAIKARASDIHIEPLPNRVRIRCRVDGVCQETHSIPKNLHEAQVSRIKILADMDITEKRKPLDGRINLEIDGRPIDVRVSTIPTTSGESVVMRLLEKSSALKKLKSMGFSESNYNNFKKILKVPNGIILITGPTGSGKSTTLYTALNEINDIERKIITVEDPIEYTLPGINQCEVNANIGLTFPHVLRTILRQDPNVIVIGEIRDDETAEIAVSAALTGHLVISTLHTNDAPSAITRLTDMGIKPFLISSSIHAVAAQRLIRVICQKCKVPYKIEEEYLTTLGLDINDFGITEFYRGSGCDHCNRTGYYGRTVILELMCITPELRDAIYRKVTIDELRKIARSNGMVTLMEDGLRLVSAHITTLEEIMRVSIN